MGEDVLHGSLAAITTPTVTPLAPGTCLPPVCVEDVSADGSAGFYCGERCHGCFKGAQHLFVPRANAPAGAAPALCPTCVKEGDLWDNYQRCVADKCDECDHGFANFVDGIGHQLCSSCSKQGRRPGYFPKSPGDRCLNADCGRPKRWVQVGSSGGVGYCSCCVPNNVEWCMCRGLNRAFNEPRVRRKRTFNDPDLTKTDKLRLSGGEAACADYMSRVEEGEVSIENVDQVRDVLGKEYHDDVVYELIGKLSLSEAKAIAYWKSQSAQPRWEHLTALLLEDFDGNGAFEEAQRRRKADAAADAAEPDVGDMIDVRWDNSVGPEADGFWRCMVGRDDNGRLIVESDQEGFGDPMPFDPKDDSWRRPKKRKRCDAAGDCTASYNIGDRVQVVHFGGMPTGKVVALRPGGYDIRLDKDGVIWPVSANVLLHAWECDNEGICYYEEDSDSEATEEEDPVVCDLDECDDHKMCSC